LLLLLNSREKNSNSITTEIKKQNKKNKKGEFPNLNFDLGLQLSIYNIKIKWSVENNNKIVNIIY